MEEAVDRLPLRIPRVAALRVDPGAIAAWLVPVVLILYLALNNGGYGVFERSDVGIAAWCLVVIGTVVGAFPVAGGTRAGQATFALLAVVAAWTAASFAWTETDERTAFEVSRVAVYLGIFGLALSIQGRDRWRHLLHGVTVAVAAVCVIAVWSRFEPTSFPERVAGDYLGPRIERRLAYPLNYSSGLAVLAAIGVPLLLAATASARTILAQALAAAAIPVVALALWLTVAALQIPVVAIGLLAFLILAPDRLPKLATLIAATAGAAILIGAVEQRDALDQALTSPAALQEGDEMKVFVLAVCTGVALIQAGIGLAVRYGRRPRWLVVSRRQATIATAATVAVAATIALAAGLQRELPDAWEHFKGRPTASRTGSRAAQILDYSSNRRYEFWQSAIDANATDPWTGIGPGAYEYWWAREGSHAFIRDSHSLYMDTLAELGIVGLVLLGGFVAAVLMIGVARVPRAPPGLRLGIAAATSACVAFAAGAALDWIWELSVVPVIFFLLVAVAVAGGSDAPRTERRFRGSREPRSVTVIRRYGPRAALAGLGVAAIVVIALPLAGQQDIERSQAAAKGGDLRAALSSARDAEAAQPYAATPRLQEALVLERLGDPNRAVRAALAATRREPTNWRTWLVLSRLRAEAGDAPGAADAYRKVRPLIGTPERLPR
jgi:hypothetical protein